MFDFSFVFCGLLNFYSFERGISLFTMNATVLSVWKWNHRQERDMKSEMAHVQMHTNMFTSMKTEDCGQENT